MYGWNDHIGCQPRIREMLINHRESVCKKWLELCMEINNVWRCGTHPYVHPPTVLVHCNQGIDRGPALMSLLASKILGCSPGEAALVLARVRSINPMYSGGVRRARGMDLTTWENMNCVATDWPLQVYYRYDESDPAPTMWEHVPTSERITQFIPMTQWKPRREPPEVVNPWRYPRTPKFRVKRVQPAFPDYDDDGEDCRQVGADLRSYLSAWTWAFGWFKYNDAGRHVLHQLAEDYRSEHSVFNMNVFLQAMWQTHSICQDRLNTRTIGYRPPNTTVLQMVCKHEWKAIGIRPGDHLYIIEQLLAWGANADLVGGARGNTVLMDVAGAGNVHIFTFFYQRIMEQNWTCDLEIKNKDGRNLWSIAGLAHRDAGAGHLRQHVNLEIQLMLRNLHEAGFILGEGLATSSSAKRGWQPRLRVEDTFGPVYHGPVPSKSPDLQTHGPVVMPSDEGKRPRTALPGLPLVAVPSVAAPSVCQVCHATMRDTVQTRHGHAVDLYSDSSESEFDRTLPTM